MFDTVPAKHSAESNVLFVRSGEYANVTTGGPICSAGNATKEEYTITTSTVDHNEDVDYTKIKELQTVRRSERPNVPGRIRMCAHLQKDVIHTDILAGDVRISFVPRNKRQSFGCVSQDDEIEYWTKQDFVVENTDYIAKISTGSESKEYVFANSPITISWEQYCNDFINLTTDKTRIEIYARMKGLLSYQPQVRTFEWKIPQEIASVQTETEGLKIIKAGLADGILVPGTTRKILYKEMPIISLPEGNIMQITGIDTYDLYEMKPGFVYGSYAVDGGIIYYEWNGVKRIERLAK